MKKKLHSALLARRGFSIAETAVALAIIMIVSAAAASLLWSATQVEEDAVHTTEISEYAESAVDCFRWADYNQDFEIAVEHLGFHEVTEEDGAEALGENDHLYVLERFDYRIEIKVNFLSELKKQFEFTAENKDGNEIYGFTYEK